MAPSSSLLVFRRSAASRIPSPAKMPRQVPAWEMASMAYSTWYKRPEIYFFYSLNGFNMGEGIPTFRREDCRTGIISTGLRERIFQIIIVCLFVFAARDAFLLTWPSNFNNITSTRAKADVKSKLFSSKFHAIRIKIIPTYHVGKSVFLWLEKC